MPPALVLKGKVYDAVKWLALVLLPGLGTLYNALASTWDLPAADKVTTSDIAICAFLGLLLGLSNFNYNSSDDRFDGTAYVDPLDRTNNPDILLKDTAVKVPKTLHLKVQQTAPPLGNMNQDDLDTPLDGV